MTGIQQGDTGQLLGQFETFASNGASSAPAWLKRKREQAIQRFDELGFPTTKQEKWRFTSVRPITEHVFTLSAETATLVPEQLDPFFLPIVGGIRLVFVNGAFAEGLSSIPELAEGVVVRSLSAALDEHGELETLVVVERGRAID